MELEQFQKFFDAKTSLLQDTLFNKCRRKILVVNRNGDPEFRPGRMQETSVTASLMMDIKSRALQCGNDLLRPEGR